MGTQEFRWIFMPYCIQQLQDGRFIVLNRAYKPLGVQTREHVDYETHPTAAKLRLTSATAKKLSWSGSGELSAIFLYNDGCVPTASAAAMKAYLARLAVLSKVKVDGIG